MNSSKGRAWLTVLAPVLASIVGLVTLRALGPDVVSQQTLSQWLQPLGRWAPLAFVLFLALRPITLLPGQVFCAVGGLLFGTLMGTVYALAGSALAVGLTFLLARKLGKRLVRRLAGHQYAALTRVAKRRGFLFAVATTLNPFLPTDVMTAAGAASGARFVPTVLGVLVGTLPGTALTAQFGSAIGQGKLVLTLLSAAGMVASLVLGVVLARRIAQDLKAETSQPEAAATPHVAPPRQAVGAP